jgi:hypothetical protein
VRFASYCCYLTYILHPIPIFDSVRNKERQQGKPAAPIMPNPNTFSIRLRGAVVDLTPNPSPQVERGVWVGRFPLSAAQRGGRGVRSISFLNLKVLGLPPVFWYHNWSGGAADWTGLVGAGMQPLTVVEHLDVVKQGHACFPP